MSAILMVLALGVAPAAVERDPELIAEEAKAIRAELITVRAELRRLKAREEALKVGRTLGLDQAETREQLRKDPVYVTYQATIRDTEAKLADIQRLAAPGQAEFMMEVITSELRGLKEKQQAHAKAVMRTTGPDRLE